MYNNIRMRLKHTGRIFCGIQYYSPCDGSNIYKSIVANIGPCMWQVESRTRAYTAMKILTYKPRRRPMCLLTNGRINYIQTKWVFGDTYILEIIYCFKIEVHHKLVFQLDIFLQNGNSCYASNTVTNLLDFRERFMEQRRSIKESSYCPFYSDKSLHSDSNFHVNLYL